MNVIAQNPSPVRIEFDEASKRIDMVTGREMAEYRFVQRGSIRFFMGRLDEPEEVIHYFHDGRGTIQIKYIRSMEKFSKEFSQWRLRFTIRSDSPQYIPRVYTLAVSFIPLSLTTREPERRVYLLLDDLKLIDWENKNN